MNELISIIVPIYNVEKYLKRCIDSILAQSYNNLEIILIDDGSKDSCPSICDEYKKKDSRVVVLHKENGGLSDARNAGINLAKGKYIAFVDSDDMIDEVYIEYMYKNIKELETDICICGFQTFTTNVCFNSNPIQNEFVCNNIEAIENIYSKDHYFYLRNIVSWNKLYNISLFKKIRFPVGKIHEDEATTYKLFFEAKKISYIGNKLYYYFQNDNGIMRRKIGVSRLDYLDALNDRYYFFKDKNLEQLSRKTVRTLYITIKDFASLKKEDINNYDQFIKRLSSFLYDNKFIFLKESFSIKEKIRIILALINIKYLTITLKKVRK